MPNCRDEPDWAKTQALALLDATRGRGRLTRAGTAEDRRVYTGAMAASDPTPPFPDVGHSQSHDHAKRQEIAEHLAALPMFSGCSKRELRHLAGTTRQHQLEAGQPLFEQGRPASAAYVIVAGRVEVRRDGQPIAQLGAGQVVGELGLLLQRPHSASATAMTPVEVIALPQSALREAVGEVPGLAWNLLQAVADRLSTDTTVSD